MSVRRFRSRRARKGKSSRPRWRGRAARSSRPGRLAYQAMLRAAKALVKTRASEYLARTAIKLSENFASGFTIRRNFSIPSPAVNSRTTCLPRSRNPADPYTADSARYLIDEAHLFVEAAHSCYQRLGNAGQRLDAHVGESQSWQLQHINVKLLVKNPGGSGPRAADSGVSQLDSRAGSAKNCCSTLPITGTFMPGRAWC